MYDKKLEQLESEGVERLAEELNFLLESKQWLLKDMFNTNRTVTRNMIAKKLNMSATWTNNIFAGKSKASDDTVIALAEVFDVNSRYLFKIGNRLHPEDFLEYLKG